MVGEAVTSMPMAEVGSSALASPKSLDVAVFGQYDIRGLQIAMDDPFLVRGFKRLRNLSGNGERLLDRQP